MIAPFVHVENVGNLRIPDTDSASSPLLEMCMRRRNMVFNMRRKCICLAAWRCAERVPSDMNDCKSSNFPGLEAAFRS